MLRKKERLSREAFGRFFSLGTRHHTPLFTIVSHPHDTLHVSVVVPKKVANRAVRRNKLRRRIYDIIRQYKKETGTAGVFIFITKPAAAQASYDALKDVVRTALAKITTNH